MNGRERMLTALDGGCPDRLPATTHHVMDYFLDTYMDGCTSQQFFGQMGLDPIYWVNDYEYTEKENESWRIESEELPGQAYKTVQYWVRTPKKTLSMVLQSNQYTTWISEHLIKEKKDIEILAQYLPSPIARKDLINEAAARYPESIIRGNIPSFDIFGQPGCRQCPALCI